MKRVTLNTLALSLLTLTAASAHPGHGQSDGGMVSHYMTSPLHLSMIGMIIGGLIYVWYRRAKEAKP